MESAADPVLPRLHPRCTSEAEREAHRPGPPAGLHTWERLCAARVRCSGVFGVPRAGVARRELMGPAEQFVEVTLRPNEDEPGLAFRRRADPPEGKWRPTSARPRQ